MLHSRTCHVHVRLDVRNFQTRHILTICSCFTDPLSSGNIIHILTEKVLSFDLSGIPLKITHFGTHRLLFTKFHYAGKNQIE